MKVVVNDPSFGIDQNGPGSATGAVMFHDRRNFMGLWVAGSMGHGYFQVPLQLVFAQFVLGIILMAFKHRLHGQKYDLAFVF